MKRFFLFMLMTCTAVMIYAVPKKVQVVFNYAEGSYKGQTEEAIALVEEDWYVDRPRYEGRFLEAFADAIQYSDVVLSSDSDVKLQVNVISVSKKGDMRANLVLVSGEEEINSAMLNGKGGTFGTFLNLFGDGMRSLGKAAASWVISSLK